LQTPTRMRPVSRDHVTCFPKLAKRYSATKGGDQHVEIMRIRRRTDGVPLHSEFLYIHALPGLSTPRPKLAFFSEVPNLGIAQRKSAQLFRHVSPLPLVAWTSSVWFPTSVETAFDDLSHTDFRPECVIEHPYSGTLNG
jgi:hypothetical protein